MQEDKGHRIHHHVQLPGGRQIEVVYLDSNREQLGSGLSCAPQTTRASSDTPVAPKPWTGDSPTTAPGEALHVCRDCAGGLVHPLDWTEESPGRWRILMRCPDCDLVREGVFGEALVERLDGELDRATAALLSDLKRLAQANMADEIEIFSRALELDLIGPSDF
ncbi:MAG: hypothetical protein WAN93_12265 [Solirubrobacteraceae bacterium]